jgi:hypothetical protein
MEPRQDLIALYHSEQKENELSLREIDHDDLANIASNLYMQRQTYRALFHAYFTHFSVNYGIEDALSMLERQVKEVPEELGMEIVAESGSAVVRLIGGLE